MSKEHGLDINLSR